MADNITPNATANPAPFKIATDEIGSDGGSPVHITRVKVAHGADGSATDASAAAPLPVADTAAAASLASLVTQTDGVEASLAAILAKLSADPATQTTLAALLTAVEALPDVQALTDSQLRAAPVAVKQAGGTLTDRSGTITAGGTAQQAMAANASRLGFSVQNLSTGDLWINPLGTAAAAQPSIKLASGVYYETPPSFGAVGAISIFGATTGQAFSAKEW